MCVTLTHATQEHSGGAKGVGVGDSFLVMHQLSPSQFCLDVPPFKST